jgi:hypothetical protein
MDYLFPVKKRHEQSISVEFESALYDRAFVDTDTP